MLLVRVKTGVSGAIVAGLHRGPGQIVARVDVLRKAAAVIGLNRHLEIIDEETNALIPWPPLAAATREISEPLGAQSSEPSAPAADDSSSVKADFDTPATLSTAAVSDPDTTSARRGRRGR